MALLRNAGMELAILLLMGDIFKNTIRLFYKMYTRSHLQVSHVILSLLFSLSASCSYWNYSYY